MGSGSALSVKALRLCQLSQRESQGLRLVAKVLGIMGKFAAAPKGAPLGELAANVVSRLRGFYPQKRQENLYFNAPM
ncbi:MAG TPA: hypothetical protein DCL93_07120 [Faecalibacterium sp.]|nr:hypothetical protein [Faecalibacterium sp.]